MAILADPLMLYLLLVVAVAAGFLLGRRRKARPASGLGKETLPADTLAGLAHLLDDQPNRAALMLAERLDVSADTLDTHLTLATLVRRRGEVDQAIRIHQRLLASSALSARLLARVELELARDYLAAGLFDRAESLLLSLANTLHLRDEARRLLLDVYERERDWRPAVAVARKLASRSRPEVRQALAQYLCELAMQLRSRGDLLGARRLLRDALAQDDTCVRASILLGRTELAAGNRRDALRALRRVAVQAPEFVPEVLDDLEQCYQAGAGSGSGPGSGPDVSRVGPAWFAGRQAQAGNWRTALERLLVEAPSMAVIVRLARCIAAADGPGQAYSFLAGQLADRPSIRGLDQLLALRQDYPEAQDADGPPAQADLLVLKPLVAVLAARSPHYRCGSCGLAGHLLHWQCPSCRSWGSTVPVDGVDGA